MSKRIDFSANAPVYDRRHGAALAPDVARSLALKAALTQGTRVLDVGAGTGRVAHAFADLGCDVVALDPALAMLDQLRSKASTRRVRAVVGEGARLPFADCVFDAAVIARVLYLAADWRAVLQETHDALKPGGFLLHEWGNGSADEEWVQTERRDFDTTKGSVILRAETMCGRDQSSLTQERPVSKPGAGHLGHGSPTRRLCGCVPRAPR